ncbi:DUF4214 domain-containing protein [Rhizobium sp. LjRoot30]|uniref:DUF4214 domain-containing protein n=1 Tax=Rhizobium sp. LjRoot30 TaxID=3342320 RepID=UPI003ECC7FE1
MTSLQEIYIAFFGRPADPEGLRYWEEQLGTGSTLTAVAGRMSAQAEFQEAFAGLSNTDMVKTIFENLFGRSPDAEGLRFYLAELEAGHATADTIAIRIVDAARDADLSTLQAKVAAAGLFTGQLDTAVEIAAYRGDSAADVARLFLKDIDGKKGATSETVDAAITKLVSASGGAQFPGHGGGETVDGVTYALDTVITPHKLLNGKESLLIGEGSADGFAVATSNATHLELGISVRDLYGTVLSSDGYAEDHVAGFDPAGSDTVLALSIASLGQRELSDFSFKLSIDTDPSEAVASKHYLLQGDAELGYSWALDANNDGVANGAGDTVHETIAIGNEQGYFMMLDMLAMHDQTGVIDVHLGAFENGALLAETGVRLDFDHGVNPVGLPASEASF